jgi:epoxyqueuosine reductase
MNSHSVNTHGARSAGLSRDEMRATALACGFTDAGVVALPHAKEDRDAARFAEWIAAGRAGRMEYLKRENEQGDLVRAKVATPFPWARSAIVCMASYDCAQPRSTDPAREDAAWIARYAWSSRVDAQRGRVPSDYHKVLLKRLKSLETKLHERYGEFESRVYVDTGPVVERSLAVAAGLGWSAKNTCLIHPQYGSYFFLAVLITGLEVVDERAGAGLETRTTAGQETGGTSLPVATKLTVPDRCGSCTRCIEACPTDALFTPYQMDATRCISYLTIEHKGPIAPELMEGMGRQVFGCDICQDVCPWNSPGRTPISLDPELAPRAELVNPSLEWLSSLDEAAFEREFNGSPVRRAQYTGLQRNTAIAIGNAEAMGTRRQRFVERLRTWSQAADEGLRAAAEWALGRIES